MNTTIAQVTEEEQSDDAVLQLRSDLKVIIEALRAGAIVNNDAYYRAIEPISNKIAQFANTIDHDNVTELQSSVIAVLMDIEAYHISVSLKELAEQEWVKSLFATFFDENGNKTSLVIEHLIDDSIVSRKQLSAALFAKYGEYTGKALLVILVEFLSEIELIEKIHTALFLESRGMEYTLQDLYNWIFTDTTYVQSYKAWEERVVEEGSNPFDSEDEFATNSALNQFLASEATAISNDADTNTGDEFSGMLSDDDFEFDDEDDSYEDDSFDDETDNDDEMYNSESEKEEPSYEETFEEDEDTD